MGKHRVFVGPTVALVALAASVLLAVSCGGSSASSAGHCVPGASATCGGPAGCMGFQVCASDGNGYGSCNCGSVQGDGGGSSGSDATVASSASGSSSSGGVDGAGGSGGSDSASSSSGGGDSGPWTPANLPGLSLWLNADVGVVQKPSAAGQVARWLDQSGNGNTATPGTNNTSTIDPAVVNGHDGLTCQGLALAGSPSLDFGTGDFAIATVFSGNQSMWAESPAAVSADLLLFVDQLLDYTLQIGMNSVGYRASLRVVVPVVGTGWQAIIARGAATDLLTSYGRFATGPTNTTISIGSTGGISLCGGGEVAEIVAVKGTLSDANRTSLMTYFKTKFNL